MGPSWREEKSLENQAQDVEIGVETVPDEGTEQEKRVKLRTEVARR
jgi:hypothetical protein